MNCGDQLCVTCWIGTDRYGSVPMTGGATPWWVNSEMLAFLCFLDINGLVLLGKTMDFPIKNGAFL